VKLPFAMILQFPFVTPFVSVEPGFSRNLFPDADVTSKQPTSADGGAPLWMKMVTP
jgi:hypothetical protein